MVRVKALPYLQPHSEHIRITAWLQHLDDEDVPLMDALPDWDPATELQLAVKLEVCADDIRRDCQLAQNDPLRVVIVWHSPGTNLRGCGSSEVLDGVRAPADCTLMLKLPGELLFDNVSIEVQLILAGRSSSRSRLAAKWPGSILWREEKTILLKGLGSRFPSERIDFAKSSWLPENAAWFLDWDDEDLEQMALKSMRLFLNAGNAQVDRAVTKTLPVDEAIREIIRFDVGRTMVIGALENDTFQHNPDYPYVDGSVGSYIRRLVRTLFPGENWESIINQYRQNRSRFDCELQARFRLFKG